LINYTPILAKKLIRVGYLGVRITYMLFGEKPYYRDKNST